LGQNSVQFGAAYAKELDVLLETFIGALPQMLKNNLLKSA